MKDSRTFIRVPALVAAFVVALLLLAGTYTVLASPVSSTAGGPTQDLPNAATFWMSGWVPINQNQTLTLNHNLGVPPEQLAVDLWFKDTDAGGIGINRANYGGMEFSGTLHGTYWRNLTANTIQVHRLPNDMAADQINVKVWVVPPPDRDSWWQNIAPGGTYVFNHNLGVTATDLNVSLWFSGTLHGIHHFSYGGMTEAGSERGAFWSRLTNNSVEVRRRLNDANVEQVRVVIVHGDPPAYDSLVAESGWVPVTAGIPTTFTHSLNWNPDMLLVRGECRDTMLGGAGIHQVFAGGDHWAGGFRGAHLQNLTANTVTIVRRPNDMICDEARVVIYKRSVQLYLPLVVNNY